MDRPSSESKVGDWINTLWINFAIFSQESLRTECVRIRIILFVSQECPGKSSRVMNQGAEENTPNIDEYSGAFGDMIPFILVIHRNTVSNACGILVNIIGTEDGSTCPKGIQLAI